jgi:hypothetical protein
MASVSASVNLRSTRRTSEGSISSTGGSVMVLYSSSGATTGFGEMNGGCRLGLLRLLDTGTTIESKIERREDDRAKEYKKETTTTSHSQSTTRLFIVIYSIIESIAAFITNNRDSLKSVAIMSGRLFRILSFFSHVLRIFGVTWLLLVVSSVVSAAPLSRPYIAYRTHPYDQQIPHKIDWEEERKKNQPEKRRPFLYDQVPPEQCPLQFTLGLAQSRHRTPEERIQQSPILLQTTPYGRRQVLVTSNYEHLHLFYHTSTMDRETLTSGAAFPWLFESSIFTHLPPVLHDVNGDGVLDVILADYDGGITIQGLSTHPSQSSRYHLHIQVPRLHVRREWMDFYTNRTQLLLAAAPKPENDTAAHRDLPSDPLHSYFEYYYAGVTQPRIRGESVPDLSASHLATLQERRRSERRRLQEKEKAEDTMDAKKEEETPPPMREAPLVLLDDLQIPELMEGEDTEERSLDGMEKQMDEAEDVDQMRGGDDMAYDRYENMMDDHELYERHNYGDDMYGRSNAYSTYYDTKHYIRLPPHLLTSPVLAEVPRLYGNANTEKDDMLFVAVSYFLDEDEYDGLLNYQRFQMTDQGDETEPARGTFVASAIMGYLCSDSGFRWTGQTHLDLSTDYTAPENVTLVGTLPVRADRTQMSALTLSSPTVADFDGNGSPEVVLGTNLGLVYVFDARQMLLKRDHWPMQMPHPVEHRVLVEDVLGDTNLELFVADIGGTMACLSHEGQVHWQRNLVDSLSLSPDRTTQPTSSSPMTLGDVDGDGQLDIVQVLRCQERSVVFAVSASTGKDLPRFPIELDGDIQIDEESNEIHHKLAQPLLVNLHTDLSFLNGYLRRNGTLYQRKLSKASALSSVSALQGGNGPGLHIVQPHGEHLFILEGSTGCTQKISIGTEVSAMVQVDDVHATDYLDLILATESGNIVTLESMAPFHPLNTWTGGMHRNHRSTSQAHGYSASQGIFLHDVSRQFTDILGVYVPFTFEIFDNRPNIQNEPDRRKYIVEVRDGPSWRRVLWRNEYQQPGVYAERLYIRFGPGHYTLYVSMQTSHGIIYEDTFTVAYNVHFLDGLGAWLWLPLVLSALAIFVMGASRQRHWSRVDGADDEGAEYVDNGREGHVMGRLGRSPLPT